ncbi:Frag1/DRAM/Sfk1 family-containing protein [Strongyloides ratti]|uniref:Frag1/DRAM/Sfk1 family-containing protein n=1 Tax=Strongyloides ratti TaxID=34506 RepID=A0A090L496_STRRB|nr:Frag1/DRAM/Sfk1 family-containing protein [Strongyloides ratti]CEF62284.1 Frag1/DRAM/Sfk1 family-containing protein [Strongyloides ratti]
MLKKVWLIPLLSLLFSFLAFFCGYIISVSEGHVNAVWPYISDTALTAYLRHRQIVEFYWHRHHVQGSWRFFSLIFLFIGYLSSLGVSMVANFQQHPSTMYAHYSGALLAFGGGLVYAWGQTIFSYIMSPKLVWKVVSHFRFFLTTIATLTFFTMIIFGCILGRSKDRTKDDHYKMLHWKSDMPNFREHIIGTCSEWIMAICFEIYILSFVIELRGSSLHAPKLDIESILSRRNNDDTKSFSSKGTETSDLQSPSPVTFISIPYNNHY